jgi:hypothetical protein
MPRYEVIITRDITESTVLEVEADNQSEAYNAAYDALYGRTDIVWEVDDCSWDNSDPYVTNVSEVGQ